MADPLFDIMTMGSRQYYSKTLACTPSPGAKSVTLIYHTVGLDPRVGVLDPILDLTHTMLGIYVFCLDIPAMHRLVWG